MHGYVLTYLRFVMYDSEVGYELVLGTTWFGYELVVAEVVGQGTYELVLGTSWLGYELAWYDLVSEY